MGGGTVHVIGSLNVDHPLRVHRHPAVGETVLGRAGDRTAGGKGLNQAVAAARAGATVRLIGQVGDDEPGKWLAQVAHAEGIDLGALATSADRLTGQAQIVVADDGANTIIVDPGANATLTIDPEQFAPQPGDVVVAQLEVPIGAVAAAFTQARAAGATTILNPSPVAAADQLRELWPVADVVVVNEPEAAELAPFLTAGSAGAPPTRSVVVTLGAEGAEVISSAGRVTVPGVEVPVVDTTGAGDCFLGVLAATLADGGSLPDAVARAVTASALSVTRSGAAASMPTAPEIAAAR